MPPQVDELDAAELSVISAFETRGVRYVVVGSYAKRVHSLERLRGDLDLLVEASVTNGERLLVALTVDLRLTGAHLSAENLSKQGQHVSLGRYGVDILTSAADPSFDDVFRARCPVDVGGRTIGVASLEHIRYMMRASGRDQDLQDLASMGLE
jgi:hypothetical protein